MELIEITEENADDFSDLIDSDVRCHLERCFFYGIGVADDEGNPNGALVYELLNYDSDEDTKSRIHSFVAKDDETVNLIMSRYDEAVHSMGVTESCFETDDEKTDGYLVSCGFTSKRAESPDIELTVGELKKMVGLMSGKKTPPYIKSMSDVSLMQYRTFLKNCLIKGRFGLLEDLGYLPMAWFECEVSTCSIADDKMDGAFLICKQPSQTLTPCLFTAFGIDYQKNLGILMLSAAQKVVENYPEENRVVIRRHNASVRKLTDKFFPNKSGNEVYIGSRKEG